MPSRSAARDVDPEIVDGFIQAGLRGRTTCPVGPGLAVSTGH